jgi:hypothetical protein
VWRWRRTWPPKEEPAAALLETASKPIRRSSSAGTYFPDLFRLRAHGATLRDIAANLNERGIQTCKGADWSQVQVKRLLDRVGSQVEFVIQAYSRIGWYDFRRGFDTYLDAEQAMGKLDRKKEYRIEVYSRTSWSTAAFFDAFELHENESVFFRSLAMPLPLGETGQCPVAAWLHEAWKSFAMRKSTTHVSSFNAIDIRGNSYALRVFANIRTTTCPDGSKSTSRGRPSIETQNGLSVERLKKGEYKVAATGLLLCSDDPRAI